MNKIIKDIQKIIDIDPKNITLLKPLIIRNFSKNKKTPKSILKVIYKYIDTEHYNLFFNNNLDYSIKKNIFIKYLKEKYHIYEFCNFILSSKSFNHDQKIELFTIVNNSPHYHNNEKINLIISKYKKLNNLLIEKLIKTRNDSIKENLLKNAKLKFIYLNKINNMNNPYNIKFLIINHPNIRLDLLKKFSLDPDSAIRIAVTKNKKLNSDILKKLAIDKDIYVRKSVAKSHHANDEILSSLFNEFPTIVLNNPNCPDFLKALSR